MRCADYESLGFINPSVVMPTLLEAFRGTDVVQWSGNIERQVSGFIDDMERSNNEPYASKLREFLKIWRDNEITGSINRETLDVLKAAASVLSVDNWNMSNYFSNLRDQLRKLIASEEELPRDVGPGGGEPMRGLSAGGGAPPRPEFGPGGAEPPPGLGEPGEPGEEEQTPAPGEAPPETPMPGEPGEEEETQEPVG